MLSAEAAKIRLAEFATPKQEAVDGQLARIKELPTPSMRAAGFGLLGRDAEGKHFGLSKSGSEATRLSEAARTAAGVALDETLTDAERRAVFSALLPGIASPLAAFWTDNAGLYQTGYARRAFRAPNRPDLTRVARLNGLRVFCNQLEVYADRDSVWLATWAGYISGYGAADYVGRLLAQAIDLGGPEGEAVFETLVASGNSEHEVGAMGRHVTRALLCANRPDGWAWAERLLLAAQRQEGLRQAVLEAIDEAHPLAFRRMIGLIRAENLLRFSSAVRAADVWFGFGWTAPTDRQTDAALELVGALLDDPDAARAALIPNGDADGQTVYLALWTLAFADAPAAIAPAGALLHDTSAERRFAAAHFLADLNLPEAKSALLVALDDAELAVAARAFAGMGGLTSTSATDSRSRFDAYVRNLPRFPSPERTQGPMVWPWMYVTASRERVANALVAARGERPPSDLLPYLSEMDSDGRASVARLYADSKSAPANAETRAVLLRFMSDASSYVRDLATKGLNAQSIGEDAATITGLEALLTRKSGDTRRTLIGMLLKQDDAGVLSSAQRLMAAKPSSPQRAAGLDLLTQMVRGERSAPVARERAAAYARENPTPNETEGALLEELTREDAGAAPTLDDALGLMNPANLTPAMRPELPSTAASAAAAPPPTGFLGRVAALMTGATKPNVALPPLASEVSPRLIYAVDEWVEQHRESPIKVKTWQNDNTELLLGSASYYFPTPNAKLPISAERERLPLFELWEAWWKDRPADLRDGDGLEALRAKIVLRAYGTRYGMGTTEQKSAATTLFAPLDIKKLRHERVTTALLSWSARLFPGDPAAAHELQRQGAQTTLALMPAAAFAAEGNPAEDEDKQKPPIDWRYSTAFSSWLVEAQEGYALAAVEGAPWTDGQITRLWNLLAWRDRPFPGVRRYRPTLDMMLAARRVGAASDDDLYDLLLGPRDGQRQRSYGSGARDFSDLNALSTRKEPAAFATTPGLGSIVARCRERIIEVELKRGDTPTVATPAALALRYAGGAETLIRVLLAFGKAGFARGSASSDVNRASVFSHLVRATFPGADDTPEAFAQGVHAAKIGETRLIETALYAPQWARHVEAAVGWPLFTEGVWWLHAHTKDDQWAVEKETREAWTAEINDKTPLTAADLVEGGVDVAWFGRVHAALGMERWAKLDEAAKFASSSGGHKRAQLFADAMLGREERATIVRRIADKRHGDAVRAFGLLPLPASEGERQAEALARYKVIQEFRRTSRQFGAQRQESEKKAARIGLENLARTAGYADPARLEWAMEAHAVADLRNGPLRAESGEVAVQLSIDALGAPVLEFTKKGKPVKTLPTAMKKDPEIAGLIERRVEIERQSKRMRLSLEEAMCRGDVFAGEELARLWEHPVLQPFLRGLVFSIDAGETEESRDPRAGYLAVEGTALETLDGQAHLIAPDARVRIAHPYDLFQTGIWERFQHDCFTHERVQPFKQVFRELYLLTENEQEEGGRISRRYAGHQVNPTQAVALLGKRGWINKPDEGIAQRSFHGEGLSASVEFVGLTFSPLDVEGLTVEHVSFTRRGEWKPIPLADVPPRVFSEAMRDLDLVVSVAHVGGVDPEASASTVEMRATLVRETAQLLHLDNVRLQRMHVLIDGALGTYSVHLGSAIVHRQPGGFLCIVPVHAQHRGRLFLPFADDDPRTAEVVSKVLLLAKDKEIKDPTILEQILAVR